ncbi:MAG: hypothetical protein JST59_02040 [Actinobacteria bacterium]|nr:hypothetical protein [Actinomycetota bacterium]
MLVLVLLFFIFLVLFNLHFAGFWSLSLGLFCWFFSFCFVFVGILIVLFFVDSFMLRLELVALLNSFYMVNEGQDEVPANLFLNLIVVDAELPFDELQTFEDNSDLIDAFTIFR